MAAKNLWSKKVYTKVSLRKKTGSLVSRNRWLLGRNENSAEKVSSTVQTKRNKTQKFGFCAIPPGTKPAKREKKKKTACTIRSRFDLSFGDTTINTIQRYNDTTIRRRYECGIRSPIHLTLEGESQTRNNWDFKKLFAIRNSLTEEILEIEISSFEKMFILWFNFKLSTAELHLKPKDFQQKHSFQNSRWIFTIGRVSCSQTKNNFFA